MDDNIQHCADCGAIISQDNGPADGWHMQPDVKADSETRFSVFCAALELLCTQHRIQLTVSGYDALQAYQLEPNQSPVYASGFDNCISKPNERGT